MSWLYPTISQLTYWGVGDIDECSILATYWAAMAAGYEGTLPSIEAFRKAAGRPDLPGPTGLTNAQVGAGIMGTGLGQMDVVSLAGGTTWAAFVSHMASGAAATIAVTAGLLPSKYRYNFAGGHRVGVAFQNGKWYIADPLAKGGSRPLEISEADLRRAALGFGGGSVSGILFRGKGMSSSESGKAEVLPTPVPVPAMPSVLTMYDSGSAIGSFYRGRHERQGVQGGVG